jgi:hypothetical protein
VRPSSPWSTAFTASTADGYGAMNQQWVSLTGELAGPTALQRIPGPPSGAPEELCLDATGVTTTDSFAAVAVQATFHQHLSANPESTACLWPPKDPASQRRLYSLLGPLPDRCALPSDFHVPERDPRIIIPAMPVEDVDEAELIARTIKAAGSTARLGNLRLAVNQAQVLATGGFALLDNALSHPSGSPCPPIVSCSIEVGSRNVQLVVHDLGSGISNDPKPLDALRVCLERSRANFGGISTTVDLLRNRGDGASMVIRTGTAQARWSENWSTREGAHSVGWGVGLLIDRDQPEKVK